MPVIIDGPDGPTEADLTYEAVYALLRRRWDGATAALLLTGVMHRPDMHVCGVVLHRDHLAVTVDDDELGRLEMEAPFCARTWEELGRELRVQCGQTLVTGCPANNDHRGAEGWR